MGNEESITLGITRGLYNSSSVRTGTSSYLTSRSEIGRFRKSISASGHVYPHTNFYLKRPSDKPFSMVLPTLIDLEIGIQGEDS